MADPSETNQSLTELLRRWSEGDENAEAEIFPLVYDELHRIAERIFKEERSDHTLQTTAIVHEAYLNLCRGSKVDWQNRNHFYGLMARVMRRVLVDHARQRNRQKRGGAAERVLLEVEPSDEKDFDLLALDFALRGLVKVDREKAKLVELRYFGGLSLDEAAEVLGISRSTAVRQWRLTRAWLFRELSPTEPSD